MRSVLALLLSTGLPLVADTRLGKPFTLEKAMPVEVLVDNPAGHTGKIVQVKGQVTEVCERMGCWMNLVDPASGKRMRVKVNDGDIVFPRDAIGKIAVAEGKLIKLQFTREQAIAAARHEAEEQGRKFDPAAIKRGSTVYQIQGDGALILD